MSELLPIDSPLLPRLRKAAAKDDDALRWLMDSARHWARGEFLRREMEGIGPKTREHVQGAMYELELTQVAVRYASLSAPGRLALDNERTAVGLLCEGCNDEYLDLQTGRAEKISGMFYIHDVFLLPPEFRCSRWIRPASPPQPAVFGSYRDGYFGQGQQATAGNVRLLPGDSYTYTTTVTMS